MTRVTRRYPWGIQRLVSTHSNCYPFVQFLWGGVFLDSQNSNCQGVAKFSLGGRDSWVVKMRIGILGKLSKNFAMPYSGTPCIADSLSHTTCVETNCFNYENTLKSDPWIIQEAPPPQIPNGPDSVNCFAAHASCRLSPSIFTVDTVDHLCDYGHRFSYVRANCNMLCEYCTIFDGNLP